MEQPIYSDENNAHAHSIRVSFERSMLNILQDENVVDMTQMIREICNNKILTHEVRCAMLTYCNSENGKHTYNMCDDDYFLCSITYANILRYVWTRITKHENRDGILEILNQDVCDGLNTCFTSQLFRLLNTLSGIYDDIAIQISDSEQISNVILMLTKKYKGNTLKSHIIKELLERQYSIEIIDEWLKYID